LRINHPARILFESTFLYDFNSSEKETRSNINNLKEKLREIVNQKKEIFKNLKGKEPSDDFITMLI
jgi:hypothetical protein